MSLNVNKDNKSTENITEKYNKPPLGATPYWVTVDNRIKELANAILRYNCCSNENTKNIKKWAREIVLYCELAEQAEHMRNMLL